MKCIDFDVSFRRYLAQWLKENRARYATPEKLEAALDEAMVGLIGAWERTPASWLGGLSPIAYFEQFDDARMLVAHLHDYFKQRVPVPDQLLERIKALKDSEAHLAALAQKESVAVEVRAQALDLLAEMDSTLLVPYALEYLTHAERGDELSDHMQDMLRDVRGPLRTEVLERALEAYAQASECGKAELLNVISIYRADERVYKLLVEAMERAEDNLALYAAYLGEYGDARAIDVLKRALAVKDFNYMDYIEIRNSIEALGGMLEGEEPSFEGDPHYEAVKRMQ